MRSSSIVALALAGACAGSSPGASTASPTPAGAPAGAATTAAAPAGHSYMSALTATGSTSSRMSGNITFALIDANTYNVAMDLRSGPSNKQVPWAIRPGPCGDMTPNSEVGGRGPYGAISTQTDGSAHVNTRIHVQIPDGPMHVEIMQSNSQRDVVLSCGPLAVR